MTELRIVRGGETTDEELAAVVVAVTSRAATASNAEPQPLRQPLSPWVASGLVKGTRTSA